MADKTNGAQWDLTSYFPSFNGPEMKKFKVKLAADISALQKKAAKLAPLSAKTAGAWEKLLLAAEDAEARLGHIMSYVNCLESAHADKDEYSAESAKLYALAAEYSKFGVDMLRAFKDAPETVFSAFIKRAALKEVAHALKRAREQARRTMSPAEEKLAADLGTDGFQSWSRLYNKISGKLEFDMQWPDGKKERLPISRWRALMSDPDRKVGRAAFEGGNKAWAGIEDACAAALNALAGTRFTLYRRRGVKHFLDQALFGAGIKRRTLDAMYAAVHKNIEPVREILRVKAAAMGRKGIAFFEREAPLPLKDSKHYTWPEGSAKVGAAFGRIYPALGDYYQNFIKKNWLESEARSGKRPGAFCTGSQVTGEQRVYTTFNGALGDINTVAHEMGHAWHGHLLKDMRPWATEYPMPLAETASIFGEHLLAEGIQADPEVSEAQKLIMLDEYLTGAAVTILDITVRFEFEKAFYEERQKGEVPVARLRELMTAAQRRIFGDTLEPGGEDPLFWASKLHFYISGVSFYNFPYTFGFLLAATLFTKFKAEGPAFLPKYEAFLRLTGSDTAEAVARRSLGADIGDPAFWATAIKGLAAPLARYKKLLEASKAAV
ncbi:MAG TPA: M3 family oligoendopeptidase [Elusimicrobiales bacterium]|nr:M3 family oligoendopeptidase [Elusimicrobiales bacterium]